MKTITTTQKTYQLNEEEINKIVAFYMAAELGLNQDDLAVIFNVDDHTATISAEVTEAEKKTEVDNTAKDDLTNKSRN